MRTVGLLTRRARAQGGLLALAGILGALACAVVVAILGWLDVAARAGLAATLADAPATDAVARFTTTLADAPAEQQAAAERILAGRLGDLPVDVHRSARSEPTPFAGAPRGEVTVGLQDARHVTTTDGTWPTDAPAAAAVPAELAARAGLSVGDTLVVADVPLTVAALWEPVDAGSPVWFDEAGDDLAVNGPVLVTEETLAQVPERVRVHWTVVPDGQRLRPADLPALRTALAGTREVLHADDDVMVLGVTDSGGLGALLASTDAALTAVRGVSVPAAALTVLVVLLTFTQVARMLVDARHPETVLLRSRGTTRGAVVLASAAEGVAVTTAGALLGAAAGTAVVVVFGGEGAPAAVVAGGALGVVTVGTVTLAAATWADGGHAAARASRAGTLAAGALGLLAVVTALAAWRLAERGSPVRVDPTGRSVLDPLAAAAVPLALVLVAVLAATLPGPVARLQARLTARRRDLARVLTAREVARRPLAHATAATFVALTVATAVLAATYTGSWHEHARDRAAVHAGADVRLTLGGEPVAGGAAGAAARVGVVPGVRLAAPGRVERTTVGGVEARTVALPSDARDAGAEASDRAGLTLPAAATRIEVQVDLAPEDPATGAPLLAGATAWVAAAPGTLAALPLQADPGGAPSVWTGALPEGQGAPWRLLAVEVAARGYTGYAVAVTRVTSDAGPAGTAPGDVPWTGWQLADRPEALDVDAGRATLPAQVVAAGKAAPVRLVPGAGDALPAVLSAPLATALDVRAGGTTSVRVGGADVPVAVEAVVPAVPGARTGRALLVDLDALDAALLASGARTVAAADEVWVRTTAPGSAPVASIVDALGTTPRDVVTADPPPAPLLQPALTVLAAAAGATALLAVGGLAATVRASDRRRAEEARVLVALGVGPSRQAWSRAAELAGTVLLAAAAGALGGAVVARLAVGTLVRATSGDAPEAAALVVPAALDLAGLLALVVPAGAGAAVVLLASALGVRARAAAAAGA